MKNFILFAFLFSCNAYAAVSNCALVTYNKKPIEQITKKELLSFFGENHNGWYEKEANWELTKQELESNNFISRFDKKLEISAIEKVYVFGVSGFNLDEVDGVRSYLNNCFKKINHDKWVDKNNYLYWLKISKRKQISLNFYILKNAPKEVQMMLATSHSNNTKPK